MSIPIYQVDAFTNECFKGNPAAVCLLKNERDLAWMQNVAAEMNLSETAFILPERDGTFGIRWCTPTVEVDLCGHATLASGWVVMNELEPGRRDVSFRSKSGPLPVRRKISSGATRSGINC